MTEQTTLEITADIPDFAASSHKLSSEQWAVLLDMFDGGEEAVEFGG